MKHDNGEMGNMNARNMYIYKRLQTTMPYFFLTGTGKQMWWFGCDTEELRKKALELGLPGSILNLIHLAYDLPE